MERQSTWGGFPALLGALKGQLLGPVSCAPDLPPSWRRQKICQYLRLPRLSGMARKPADLLFAQSFEIDLGPRVPWEQLGFYPTHRWKPLGSFKSSPQVSQGPNSALHVCIFLLEPRILARHSSSIPGKQNLLKSNSADACSLNPTPYLLGTLTTLSGTLLHNPN